MAASITRKCVLWCVLFIACAACLNVSQARIVGTFVLPHGGIALAPKYFNTTNHTAKSEAWALHNSAEVVGQKISQLRPDVIFLSTPHGISSLTDFLFYLNTNAYGVAETDNCDCPPCCYNVTADLDFTLSQHILSELKDNSMNVSGIVGYGPPGNSEVFPLRWGEVVPLYFALKSHSTEVVILSHPSRRYNHSDEMIPELLSLGSFLYQTLNRIDQTVAVVISADLAHTHDKNGPYGYSPDAEPFDKACGRWATTLNEGDILDIAAKYVNNALSCGYTGLVMLHGLLRSADLSTWQPHLYANYHPSYYGMMVAEFMPKTW
ncbi:protein TTE1956-like [Saccoglossus kowalevskii]|uniref:Uncharacterized protein LOC100372278 n=1 Tax=Saccoglossus kowalevskii TaxID=10224 RepID=A0ABM0GS84_SACKO|nr:PREDICTED: uncharacterized protein LOC100372278 [Saccoglossus kowalevskii]